jgi:hypothetical protein
MPPLTFCPGSPLFLRVQVCLIPSRTDGINECAISTRQPWLLRPLCRVVQNAAQGQTCGRTGSRGHGRSVRSCQLRMYMSLMCSTRSAGVKSKLRDTLQGFSTRLSRSNPNTPSRTLRFHELGPAALVSEFAQQLPTPARFQFTGSQRRRVATPITPSVPLLRPTRASSTLLARQAFNGEESHKRRYSGLAAGQWCLRLVIAPATEDDIAAPIHCISPRQPSGASHCPRMIRGPSP